MADKPNGNGKDTLSPEDKKLTVTWTPDGAFQAQWSQSVGTSDLLAFSKWLDTYVTELYARQVVQSIESGNRDKDRV